METPEIFIDWTPFELSFDSRRKREPRFFWRGTAPDFSREVIVACKDNTVVWDEGFDGDFLTFTIIEDDETAYWAYPVWRECKPEEKPVLPLVWHPLRLLSSSPNRWEGELPVTDDDNVLVALDTGRVIAGDSFDLETGSFEISPAERVRFWSYGTWMEELKKTKEKK